MDSIIGKLRIHTLKAQLVLRQSSREALAKEFENEALTNEQRAEIGRRWVDIFTEKQTLERTLDLLERQEREGREGAKS